MEDLFRALPALLKEFSEIDENGTLREAVVFATWRRIAGESLLQHAVPIRLYRKHLIIAVAHETWKRHLERLSGEMIFKINSKLGAAQVTFIEFRVDDASVSEYRAAHRKNFIADEDLEEIALDAVTPNLRFAADAIKDENLRYQFLLAAGGCLARKQRIKNSTE